MAARKRPTSAPAAQPARQPRNPAVTVNQIDQISQAIGRLDAYTHEGRHGINNLSQKVDALDVNSAKRHDSLKIELSNQIERIADAIRQEIAVLAARVAAVEAEQQRAKGAISVWKWLAEHWPFAIIGGMIIAFIAWANEVKP